MLKKLKYMNTYSLRGDIALAILNVYSEDHKEASKFKEALPKGAIFSHGGFTNKPCVVTGKDSDTLCNILVDVFLMAPKRAEYISEVTLSYYYEEEKGLYNMDTEETVFYLPSSLIRLRDV